MNIDYLTRLPADLVIKQLTYLPFDDVIKVCTSNNTLHQYCVNSKYNNWWKTLVDNTFSNIYNYNEHLNEIQQKLKLDEGTYNYMVYTKLINLLDPITQLMIYYKQGDTKSFNDQRFDNVQRFLALFLLNKPNEMGKYLSVANKQSYMELLKGNKISKNQLNTMLFQMVENGNVKGVELLKRKGANIHIRNDYALGVAGVNNYLKMMQYLIKNGADIHAEDDLALRSVSEYGHIDIVKYLVENGANIHAREGESFRLASLRGHINVMKYLVEKGADIHDMNEAALVGASHYGYFEVVKYLVENGADIHARDEESLLLASTNKHLNVVKYLLEQGVNKDNVNSIKTRGGTSLLMEMSMLGLIDSVKYLLNIGANVNFTAPYGWTALMFATLNQHTNIVKLLVEAGANVNAQTTPDSTLSGGGWSTIMFAFKNGNKDLIQYLIDHGADVEYATKWLEQNPN